MPSTSTRLVDAIPELAPELPAEQFASSNWVGWFLVALCIVLVGSGLYLYLYRRRTRTEAPPVSRVQQALESIDELQAHCPPLLREFSLKLSMILRVFLQGELHDPALYETHEEFSRRIDSLAAVPESPCSSSSPNLNTPPVMRATRPPQMVCSRAHATSSVVFAMNKRRHPKQLHPPRRCTRWRCWLQQAALASLHGGVRAGCGLCCWSFPCSFYDAAKERKRASACQRFFSYDQCCARLTHWSEGWVLCALLWQRHVLYSPWRSHAGNWNTRSKK